MARVEFTVTEKTARRANLQRRRLREHHCVDALPVRCHREPRMDQHAFEAAVLRMWTSTRIPLTRANIQAFTGERRGRIESWLGAMVDGAVVAVESGTDGEPTWIVRGSARPDAGPRTVGEAQSLERLRREVDRAPEQRIAVRPVSGLAERGESVVVVDSKSLVLSGVLSFFLGPLGWLYAAPMGEALPALLVYLVAGSLLPHAFIASVLGVLAPFSALAGVTYAWRYNRTGRRTPLLGTDTQALPPGRPRNR